MADYSACPSASPPLASCPDIIIQNPIASYPGHRWRVEYFSSGAEKGFSITATSCTPIECTTITLTSGTLSVGESDTILFSVDSFGRLSVPQFPMGMFVVIGILAPSLLILSRISQGQQSKYQRIWSNSGTVWGYRRSPNLGCTPSRG